MALLTQSVSEVAASPAVRACIEWFRRERAWINEQHLKLCRVPAPTFFEQKRAEWMAEKFRSLQWDAKIDRAGNVIATRGSDPAARVAVTAHLDTVLAPRSPEEIKVAGDGRMLGPGVSDNGAGLAALIALAAAWNANPPSGEAPALIANVGEEGEGNLSGMRYLCRPPIDRKFRAFLVLDGPALDHITCQALASRRFDVTMTGPGGHSWSDAGTANPVHALSRAVTAFLDEAPVSNGTGPRSSFNFGVMEGGSSINSIPSEAHAKVDLRSENPERIDHMAALLATVVDRAVELENSRKGAGKVAAKVKEIGSRPGGSLDESAPMVEMMRAVDSFLGVRSHLGCSSTDANIPLSLGIPAVSIGTGGQGGGAHTAAEWYSPEGREAGLQRVLLAVCLLLGGS